jgi:heme-degrading monooxygenase HmoA
VAPATKTLIIRILDIRYSDVQRTGKNRGVLAQTPDPPYYAVIFVSRRRPGDDDAYGMTSDRMFELAAQQPGYLGVDSARDDIGITVSYWRDAVAIAAWKNATEHAAAQESGRARWYDAYEIRIAKVERAYAFVREDA